MQLVSLLLRSIAVLAVTMFVLRRDLHVSDSHSALQVGPPEKGQWLALDFLMAARLDVLHVRWCLVEAGSSCSNRSSKLSVQIYIFKPTMHLKFYMR